MRRRLAALALAVSACAPPGPRAPSAPETPKQPPADICLGAPPLAHAHTGILRRARCDREAMATMANVGEQVGAACHDCHLPRAGDPSKLDYQASTPRREIANWMSAHLMASIKPADGSPLSCRSCHTDALGRPILKILGKTRDPVKVNEWMSLVMVRRFTAVDGSKLKCKSCHVGTPSTPEFRAKVIGVSEQIPSHVTDGKGTSAF